MQKVNVKNIIKDHLATVCDGTSRAGVRLRIWFPALAVTAPLSCQPGGVQDICLALLLLPTNGLFQLCSRGSHFEQRARLIRAAHANLSFSILVATISTTFAIIYLLVSPDSVRANILSFVLYFLISLLALALLLFLGRFQALIIGELYCDT